VQWRDLKGIARNYLCMVPGIPSTLDARNAWPWSSRPRTAPAEDIAYTGREGYRRFADQLDAIGP
jgi:hypothetical protein